MDENINPVVCLSSETFEMILNHLTGRELIRLTEVSPEWDTAIGASHILMNKIKVRITNAHQMSRIMDDFKSSVLMSPRLYQHLEVTKNSIPGGLICEILSRPNQCWRTLKAKCIRFESEFTDFMSLIESSIEELEIEEAVKCYSSMEWSLDALDAIDHNVAIIEQLRSLTLPKLKVFRTKRMYPQMLYEAFANCQNLNELKTTAGTIHISFIQRILVQNKHLEVLHISSYFFRTLFLTNFCADILKNLKSFAVYGPFKTDDVKMKTLQENFLSFLHSHKHSLETFSIESWIGADALNYLFNLPQLKCLTIKKDKLEETSDWTSLKLKPSKSIESLVIFDRSQTFNVMKTFLKATPNIKDLSLFLMNQEEMEYLSSNFPQLKSLKIRTLTASDFRDLNLFPNLEYCFVDTFFVNPYDEINNEHFIKKGTSRFVELFIKNFNYFL
ncbi:CLUMA_CG004036, isoform A [Clunio marinus]|uniref:CLUMA_CG004036, isoform A n=1 Tax=Clunio marinus TaxID=568069 RepID=A0A1J1HQI0_9DIPT|nr:CLUMA_CG004036, isoform A [Clunio marinus]